MGLEPASSPCPPNQTPPHTHHSPGSPRAGTWGAIRKATKPGGRGGRAPKGAGEATPPPDPSQEWRGTAPRPLSQDWRGTTTHKPHTHTKPQTKARRGGGRQPNTLHTKHAPAHTQHTPPPPPLPPPTQAPQTHKTHESRNTARTTETHSTGNHPPPPPKKQTTLSQDWRGTHRQHQLETPPRSDG